MPCLIPGPPALFEGEDSSTAVFLEQAAFARLDLHDDAAVNRGVKRYAADEKARDYIRRYYTPTGRISDPVLSVHTTYDPLIPGRDVSYYNVIAGLAGTQDMFVQKFVAADGHCNINAARTAAAFDSLLLWIREKKRPAAGELQ